MSVTINNDHQTQQFNQSGAPKKGCKSETIAIQSLALTYTYMYGADVGVVINAGNFEVVNK